MSKIKYKEDYARMAEVACSEGPFTDLKLSKLFNVSKSTINNWKHDYPEFYQALQRGKEVFDITVVEKSFLKRCSGYFYNETVREPRVNDKTITDPETGLQLYDTKNTKMIVVKRTRKHVVPDAKGCMDWLCNRQPDRWKKVKHVEISGKDGGPVKSESFVSMPSGPMSIEQWEKEVRAARDHDKDTEPGKIPNNA